MKKAAEKSIFARFKPFWDHGKNFFLADKKIGFCIQTFAVNSIFSQFKLNSNVLNESERKELELMIKELAAEKKSLGPEASCSQEEFENFLSTMFSNVDNEDRHGEVTMKTSASFKLLGELIDVITQWGDVPEDWNKKRKYCKFKAVDIFKALKQGLVPKRGGPKEEEDEVSKELNTMINEGEQKGKIEENIFKNILSNFLGGESQPVVDLGSMNINTNINQNQNLPAKDINQGFKNLNLNNNPNNPNNNINLFPNTEINPNLNSSKNSLGRGQSKLYTNEKKPEVSGTPQPDFDLDKLNISKSIDIDKEKEKVDITKNLNTQITSNKDKKTNNININNPPDLGPRQASIDLKKNTSLLAPDFHVDSKITKKLDYKLPVKFKGIDYFKLCDVIKKHLDTGRRELITNKIDKTLAHCELAYYYLMNIEK